MTSGQYNLVQQSANGVCKEWLVGLVSVSKVSSRLELQELTNFNSFFTLNSAYYYQCAKSEY